MASITSQQWETYRTLLGRSLTLFPTLDAQPQTGKRIQVGYGIELLKRGLYQLLVKEAVPLLLLFLSRGKKAQTMQGRPLRPNTNYTSPTLPAESTSGFFLAPDIIPFLAIIHANAFPSVQ